MSDIGPKCILYMVKFGIGGAEKEKDTINFV